MPTLQTTNKHIAEEQCHDHPQTAMLNSVADSTPTSLSPLLSPSITPDTLSIDSSSSSSSISTSTSPSTTSTSPIFMNHNIISNKSIQQPEGSSSLMGHSAIVYASDRLTESSYTSQFHTINVFDFDQTLFQSPLPNPALWEPNFLGILTSWNYCGTGWWHNPGTLELGPEIESTCWQGWWNEQVVQKVKESSEDPGCLTLLLTGRNGPTFSQKIIEMVQLKGLDFDLIATKPTTVARIETQAHHKSKQQPAELYVKVHTFNTKHDLLYNILFEYPHIRSMHLWDDRPCQIAMFQEVGQVWLDENLLDNFEITPIQEPLVYMDPKREIDLVFAMVEANNIQADIEASGGPFLVPGVGLHPKTRPELADRDIWAPYETYSPRLRSKIEILKVIRYTGVMFSESVQKVIKEKLGNFSPSASEPWISRPKDLGQVSTSKWVVPDVHVTLQLGAVSGQQLEDIGGMGATVLVEVEAVGEYQNRIWSLKVKEFDLHAHENNNLDQDDNLCIVAPDGNIFSSFKDLRTAYNCSDPTAHTSPLHERPIDEFASYLAESVKEGSKDQYKSVDLERLGHITERRNITPHITMTYDRLNRTAAVDSGLIKKWDELTNPDGTPFQRRIILVGTVGEKCMLGIKTHRMVMNNKNKMNHQNQHHESKNVDFVHVIKNATAGKKISTEEVDRMIAEIKAEMSTLSIENNQSNMELIETLAQEIYEREEMSKAAIKAITA